MGEKSVSSLLALFLNSVLGAGEQYHNGREYGVGSYAHTDVERLKERLVEELGKQDAVDHQHDVVAYEHGAHKAVGVAVEYRK